MNEILQIWRKDYPINQSTKMYDTVHMKNPHMEL